MPRFENEGFRPNNRRDVDRTVPTEENYYGINPVDLDFNNRERPPRHSESGINPCDEVQSGYSPINPPQRFQSETAEDYRPTRQSHTPPPPPEQRERKPKKKKRKPRLLVIIIAVILIVVLVAVGVFSMIMNRINYNDKEENTYVSAEELESSDSVKNILLLGVDARAGENAQETRSDTMMLVSLDSKHHTIKLTSFLRDTWVYIPTLGYEQRLNAACSSGGYQGVVDAIEYNFGVAIDGYAVVDFDMFKVLVDSLGGVEVDVTEAEADEVTGHPMRYGNVTLESGKYKLTGEQALAYCRIRKIDTDFVRTERQRTVMSAIISSAKHSGPLRLMNMAYKSAPYIETDLTKSEIKALIGKAAMCLGGDIQQTKVPFEGTWDYATIYGNSVIAINKEKNRDQLVEYIYETN